MAVKGVGKVGRFRDGDDGQHGWAFAGSLEAVRVMDREVPRVTPMLLS